MHRGGLADLPGADDDLQEWRPGTQASLEGSNQRALDGSHADIVPWPPRLLNAQSKTTQPAE